MRVFIVAYCRSANLEFTASISIGTTQLKKGFYTNGEIPYSELSKQLVFSESTKHALQGYNCTIFCNNFFILISFSYIQSNFDTNEQRLMIHRGQTCINFIQTSHFISQYYSWHERGRERNW